MVGGGLWGLELRMWMTGMGSVNTCVTGLRSSACKAGRVDDLEG